MIILFCNITAKTIAKYALFRFYTFFFSNIPTVSFFRKSNQTKHYKRRIVKNLKGAYLAIALAVILQKKYYHQLFFNLDKYILR